MAQQSLTQDQMVSVLRQAGWEDPLIPWALEVAKLESGWQPGILNDTPQTGDLSYGLFQINMLDEPGYKLGEERRAKWGIQNEDLRDPVVNARIARDLLDSQGPNAWSVTHGGAIPFPDLNYRGGYAKPKSFKSGMLLESQGLPGAAYGATQGMDVSQGDFSGVFDASFPSRDIPANQDDPRFAASDAFIAGVKNIFGAPEQQSLPSQPAQMATSPASNELPAGQFSSPVEYLTGDTSHVGFRDDHGGSNYHEHLAYSTPELAKTAAALLNQHGIQTTELKGVNTVGGHSPNSYHYVGQAFDVPAHQVPVGQEPALSAQVRRILRIA